MFHFLVGGVCMKGSELPPRCADRFLPRGGAWLEDPRRAVKAFRKWLVDIDHVSVCVWTDTGGPRFRYLYISLI